MRSKGLILIGARFYSFKGGDRRNERMAKCIQKSLNGRNEWFYFNKGFRINENRDETIKDVIVAKSAFDSTIYLYSSSNKGFDVNVSAIVGQNGTGKSCIVDTIIRLINNLSAAIIGEDFDLQGTQIDINIIC